LSTELIFSGDVKVEPNGRESATRVWYVPMRQPAALAELGLIPNETTHPQYPSLIVRSITSQYLPNSAGESLVTAEYDNGRGNASLNPVNPTATDFRSWSIEYRIVEVPIPYWIHDPAAHQYPGETGPVTIDTWPIQMWKHKERRTIIRYRTVIMEMNPGVIAAIGDQNDHLHLIGGRWYKFECGTIDEQETGRWAVTYSWERDHGTPDGIFGPQQVGYLFPSSNVSRLEEVYPNVPFTRPPFHDLIPLPGDWSPGPPPFIEPPHINNPVPNAIPNANGWQNLPGVS
jgi:hypothetical protein